MSQTTQTPGTTGAPEQPWGTKTKVQRCQDGFQKFRATYIRETGKRSATYHIKFEQGDTEPRTVFSDKELGIALIGMTEPAGIFRAMYIMKEDLIHWIWYLATKGPNHKLMISCCVLAFVTLNTDGEVPAADPPASIFAGMAELPLAIPIGECVALSTAQVDAINSGERIDFNSPF